MPTLFTRLSADETKIDFRNLLKEDNENFNVTNYPYFYNGGGVAVGDINNDGLPDICFTGNMVRNRLYINRGNFHFKDITPGSHIAEKEGWCTGVTMVDINNDGWLDIYICRSGLQNIAYRRNLLFINNHDETFTEQAAAYGLDDPGYSTQASFFDYDKDGDLDMFLINHSAPEFSKGNTQYLELKNQRGDTTLENKLYRNDNGHFHDVSQSAGIRSNKMTFSLGLVTSDIDMDGWPDIYVTNDFKEPDYLYINNHDGTFTDKLKDKIDHTSLYSMGCDVADYNNDLLPDIIVPDMLPEKESAQKMHLGGDNYNTYKYLFDNGMSFQYMKNSLQKNNGDGTFSEIGQLAAIANTDWSWAPLIADYDNDGMKDIFISNGYKRDNTNVQFIMYSMDQSAKLQNGGKLNVAEYISKMPSVSLPNYIFRNAGNDRFENKINEWGLNEDNLSSGAVYADLDNDGNLDLVINNTDEAAGIYRNNGAGNHYIKLQLKGSKGNASGIGAKIFLYSGNNKIYLEQQPVRGFQSSVDPTLNAGLGKLTRIDSLRIIWPNDKTELLSNVAVDKLLTLAIADAHSEYVYKKIPDAYFTEKNDVLHFRNTDKGENDFNKQSLLMRSYTHNGPCMAKADVNGDGLEDLFIGGSENKLFLQAKAGGFTGKIIFDSTTLARDAVFFDANNDGAPDLYIVSDGYRDQISDDRLFLNDGKGNFHRADNALPHSHGNESCVRAADIDGDGDMDLFIGGSVVYGRWPESAPSSIYLNDGNGHFTDATSSFSKELINPGIVTDAVWADVNGDKVPDLVICGEWMSPQMFINHRSHLEKTAEIAGQKGWWNKIVAADFDKDGDIDFVFGNYGLNSQLKASAQEPLQLYAKDIDKNGSIDPIVTYYNQGKSYPFAGMDDVTGQVPSLKKKFYDYGAYSTATIKDIFPDSSAPQPLTCNSLSTTYFENTGRGFIAHALPVEMQYAPVYSMIATDVDQDGTTDIIAFGNNAYNRIKLGRDDANHGTVLLNDGKGKFRYINGAVSGLNVRGDTRSSCMIGDLLFAGINNGEVRVCKKVSRKPAKS